MEPVTNRENILRGISVSTANRAKTHCTKGHPLSGDNLRIVKCGRERLCITCSRRRGLAYYHRRYPVTSVG
jgi:hypothetical protein